jgi:uncharacterized protein YjbI with pentapeptide repeats
LQEIVFKDCKIVGIDFSLSNPLLLKLKFLNCLIQGANFSDLKLGNTTFYESTIKESDFLNCDLTDSDFSKTNLEGTLFHHTNLSRADFRDATGYTINPLANTLKKAIFSMPEAARLLEALDIIVE